MKSKTQRLVPVKFVIPRPGERGTFAIVRARVRREVQDIRLFRQALIRAITQWIRTTRNGRAAWEGSDRDFNIGDLACYIEYAHCRNPMTFLLEAYGIFSLKIETMTDGSNTNWDFDDLLVSGQLRRK